MITGTEIQTAPVFLHLHCPCTEHLSESQRCNIVAVLKVLSEASYITVAGIICYLIYTFYGIDKQLAGSFHPCFSQIFGEGHPHMLFEKDAYVGQ